MGRIIARDLLRTAGRRVRVVVADRDVSAVEDLPVETARVDVADPASLRRALDGAFATIASLPYRFNLIAMSGALEAGVHYIDLGGLFHTTRRQLELAPEFERRGVMAILGMGSAPGILNVLAVLAARDLETIREIHCLAGSVDRTRFRNLPPIWFDYSPDTLLDEFVMPAAVFRAGKFAMVPPLDPRERMPVRFPAPIGTIAVDTTLHSEVATLPLSFRGRGVREVTFRQGFDPEFRDKVSFLAQLGLADRTALGKANEIGNGNGAGSHRIVPREVLLVLVNRLRRPAVIGRPNRYEVLRTVVVGARRGRRAIVTADCHAGADAGWGIGPDVDTGAPPSIAVQLMLAGELAIRAGVWAPEQVVPPVPFVRELARRGMRVTCRRGPAASPLTQASP
jgi:saccharopine dehydrogenase-like NADP-dependent oxidoreductase